MMMTTQHPLVAQYLQQLRDAVADLPMEERDELVSNIAEHIVTSLAEIPEPVDGDVSAVLQRLGSPAAIAAEARGQSSGRAVVPDKPGILEWGGIVMLGVGSYLLPVVGTVAGLVMISMSRWWSTPQKVLAVAISLVGALLVPLLGLGFFVISPGLQENAPTVSYEVVPSQSPHRTIAPLEPR